jgi:predicted HTH transcriptional regulator
LKTALTKKSERLFASEKAKGKGNENFANWISRVIAPRIMIALHDFECGGKDFSIMELEPTYQSPVKFNQIPYIRITENTRPLSEFPDIERAIWTKTAARKFEEAIAFAGASAEDVFKLLDVNAYYALAERPKPRSKETILQQLSDAHYLRDMLNGKWDITNLGALLLAFDLKAFSGLLEKAPRVIKYTGVNKLNAEPEKQHVRGYACGFEDLLNYVKELVAEERTVRGKRVTALLYHEDILRELLANALVHQDFMVSGTSPMIEVFRNRIEFTNPGPSLIERDMMLNGKQSRNVKLAAAMFDMGLCEQRGSGLDKAFQAAEDTGLPSPDLVVTKTSTNATVFAETAFDQMKKGDKLRSLYFHCALRYAERDYMTNASLRERFGLPASEMQTITDLITTAKKGNKIILADPEQKRRNASYIPYWAG